MGKTLKELADFVGGTLRGDGSVLIHGVNGLKEAGAGEIAFLANPRYLPELPGTRASAVILAEGHPCPVASIVVRHPDLAFARVAELLGGPAIQRPSGVHPSAVVSPGATVGRDVSIGAHTVVEPGASIGDGTVLCPQVYVGHEARIGPGCLLYPQVVVRERCQLGARVILHSGVVVGSDGFGYATEKGVHRKIPQIGIAVLEDDVEVGAGTTIDRARFGRTVIKAGAKIDNLVMIAHNVVVGEGALIAAQAGISGSTRLGKHVMVGGQVGMVGHAEVGDRAIITAKTGVSKDVSPGAMISGEYGDDHKTHLKQLAAIGKLPEALAEIKRLRKELAELREKR